MSKITELWNVGIGIKKGPAGANGIETIIEISCGDCDHKFKSSASNGLRTNQVIRRIEKAGWSRKKQTWTCPTCQEKAKMEKVENKASNVTDIRVDWAKAAPVIVLLDNVFDKTTRSYCPGYSDDEVAKDTNMSVDFVKDIRRKVHGQLAAPPALIAVTDDLKNLKDEFETMEIDFQIKLEELTTRVDAMRMKATT